MTTTLAPTGRTRVRRYGDRASCERSQIHAVLDEVTDPIEKARVLAGIAEPAGFAQPDRWSFTTAVAR